jgi:alpha-ketoglutarate-dependent taurine dioxygenase
VLTEMTTDRRAWQADSIDALSSWYLPLPARCRADLDGFSRDLSRPVTALLLPANLRAAWSEALAPIRDTLERGRGFVLLEAPPPGRHSDDDLRLLYWLVGQALGRPVEQNVQGALLYDVRDTGQDVRSGARFSVTNAESGFHTDNSFGSEVVDYVGLLCLKAARNGGVNQIVSAYTAVNELLSRRPEVVEVLTRPFHVDRRGGLRPGDAPTVSFPVLRRDGQGLTCRYLRYWIEAGHEKAGQPLTPGQRAALDALDAVLGEPARRVEFALRPGEMLFLNNRWLFHNRTAFEDHAELERRRHLVRLWLARAAE